MSRRTRSGDSTAKDKAPRARIAVKVQPGAAADRLIGKANEEWKITLTAPPVEGRANRACTEFLARVLGVPRSAISILHGETSRRKLVQIDGMPLSEVESKLDHVARKSR
ncbi:MAG: DUF167 domain-containing protein [Bryobacterales bacterium]